MGVPTGGSGGGLEYVGRSNPKDTLRVPRFVCPLLIKHLWINKVKNNEDLMFVIPSGLTHLLAH